MEEERYDRLQRPWLGGDAVDPTDLEDLELRLGVDLPPDYRAFLETCDGWRHLCDYPFGLTDLLPARQVDWFARADAGIGRLEHYTRDLADDELVWDSAPAGSLRASLLIGDFDGNECLLLNPTVVTDRGEWQVLTFAADGGEIDLLPSFWEFMHEYVPEFDEEA